MKKKYYYIIAITVILIAVISIVYCINKKQIKSKIKEEDIIYNIYYSDGVIGSTRVYSIQIDEKNNVFVEETMTGSVLNAKPEVTTKKLKISNKNLEELKELLTEMETCEIEDNKMPMNFYITDKIQNKTYKCEYGKENYDEIGKLLDSIGAITYYTGIE